MEGGSGERDEAVSVWGDTGRRDKQGKRLKAPSRLIVTGKVRCSPYRGTKLDQKNSQSTS